MGVFGAIVDAAKNQKAKIEKGIIERKVAKTNESVELFNAALDGLPQSIRSSLSELPKVDEGTVEETIETLKKINADELIKKAASYKTRLSLAREQFSSLDKLKLPDAAMKQYDALSDVTVENIDTVEGFLKAISSVVAAQQYHQKLSGGGKIRFVASDFFKSHGQKPYPIVRSCFENPNIIATMGVGNMFGGAIGGMHVASSLVGIASSAYNKEFVHGITTNVTFFRVYDDLPATEKVMLLTAHCQTSEGLLSFEDYQKAFWGIIWNNGRCQFEGVGKETGGAFSQTQLNDKEKLGVGIATKLISESIAPIEQIEHVVASKYESLTQIAQSYLSGGEL